MKTHPSEILPGLKMHKTPAQLALGVFFVVGMLLVPDARAQSYAMSNLWTVVAGAPSHPFMSTNDNATRGIAYSPATDHVLVPSRTGSNAVYILSGTTGAILGTLPFDTNLIKGGTFTVNMAGVTADGVIYVANLTTDAAANPFRLYRWANETAQPELAYSGDPSGGDTTANNRRYGDSLALRGTGTDTQILLGTLATAVALMRTTDGTSFYATKITTDVANGDTRYGIAWGIGNTFWAKQGIGNLKNVTLDLVADTGQVTSSISLPAGPGGGLDIDLSRNLLAVYQASGTSEPTNHGLRLFDISNPAAPIQVDTVQNIPVAYTNGNVVSAVSMRNGKLFALETNNGILGYYLQGGIFYPVSLSSFPGDVILWEGAQNWTYSVVLGGTPPYSYQWRLDGKDLPGETKPTLKIPTAGFSAAGAYEVVVTNYSGSVTGGPSILTIQAGNRTAQVTNIWNIAPDTRPYMTSDGYREYAVAINPLTTNVIVVTTKPNPTNMMAVVDIQTGAHKHYIDYSGLTPSGPTPFNRVTVADDGTVFICNFTGDVSSTPFTVYGLSDDSPVPPSQGFLFSGDPGNGVVPSNVGWGANIDARGGGTSTEILVGSGKWASTPIVTKAVAILRYNAGLTFDSTPITVTNAPDSNNTFRFGVCWGGGNTFWVKGYMTGLMLVEYDLASGTGWIKKTYPTSGDRSVPPSFTGMAFDAETHLLAGLRNGSPPTPVSVPIYDMSDTEAGPLWVDQELFTTYNADIEFQGTVSFERGYIAALGVNNGLKALKVTSNYIWPPVLRATPEGGNLVITWDSRVGTTYQLQSVESFSKTWQNLGSAAAATTGITSRTNPISGGAMFYRVVAQ